MNFKDLYSLDKMVGQGSFGEVYRSTNRKTGESCAVKVIAVATSEDRLNSSHEAAIWRRLDHVNIVRFLQVLKTPTNYYIVVEYINGGNLFDQILSMSSYTEHDACVYVHQLLNALDYLAKKRVIHRDIKPDNLLLMEMDGKSCLKLTDFGVSVRLPRGTDEITCEASGAPLYAAPEVVLEETISYSVDLWACGVVLFILLSGYPPFWNEKTDKLLRSITTDQVSFPSPYWDNVSENAKDFIQNLLEKDKRKRLTARQALDHIWIGKESMAPRIHRHTTLEKLRVFNARRKLRGVIFTIQAMNRATRMISRLASMEDKQFNVNLSTGRKLSGAEKPGLPSCKEEVLVGE